MTDNKPIQQPVGRESEAHPAISIIPSLDFERYHLPPNQGDKCRVPRMFSVKSFRRRSSSVTVKKKVPPGTKARIYCGIS
jgi:hypothetical protein